ncbi:hypothetical protein [Priestia megaterium]|uniref:hypothetical protein n=1 Tax=Priestia megaterium TaxID=1404 RepID=UPI003671C8D6
MTLTEIKEMVATLFMYEDSDIQHIIANRFELRYLQSLHQFQIFDYKNDYVDYYEEVEETSLALYNMLQSSS